MTEASKEMRAREEHSPATSLEVRERLVEALKLDLVGPGPATRLQRSDCRPGCAPRTGI